MNDQIARNELVRQRIQSILPNLDAVGEDLLAVPSGSHAPAWEQVATLWRCVAIRAAGAAKTAFPCRAWERDGEID